MYICIYMYIYIYMCVSVHMYIYIHVYVVSRAKMQNDQKILRTRLNR